MNWFSAVCLGTDQLVNAITGGNPDISISARIGYHVRQSRSTYWKTLSKIVDVTFYPLDGAGHCDLSYMGDMFEDYAEELDELEKGVLALTVTVSCILLIIPIYLLALCNKLFSQ